jgi:transposase
MNTIRPVAGVDVAKAFSEFCLLAPDNSVLATLHIRHDVREDIEKAVSLLQKSEKDFGCSPIVIMESTGHYHKILFHALAQREIDVIIVNPIQSDSIKNLDVRKVKNDKWDAKRLALLYRIKGESLRTAVLASVNVAALKDLVRQYYDIQDELTAHKLRLTGLVDRVLLGFEKDFFEITSMTGLAVLKAYPSAKAILRARPATIINLIAKTSRKGQKRAEAKYAVLRQIAQTMLDLGDLAEHLTLIIRAEISLIESLQAVLATIMQSIQSIVEQDRQTEHKSLAKAIDLLISIPGIGFQTAVTMLAEFGDVTAFQSAQALTAYCGLDPSVKQSGSFKGTRNKISKRGPRLLRRALFHVASANVRTSRNDKAVNPHMQAFYKSKCQSKPKMVALVAVMHKMLFIIFAVLRDQKPFEFRDPIEHAARLAAKVA